MVHLILTASYTDSISTLAFDPSAGTLALVSSVRVGHHPSWIASHPKNQSLVFTGLEQSEGRVVAVSYDDAGKGTVVGEPAGSGGSVPCSLIAVDDSLFVANYSSGTVATLPVSPATPYILASSPSATLQLTGSGPNKSRQEASHPHQVVVYYNGSRELLVPDLGADVVRRYAINPDGSLQDVGNIKYEAGSGPRHVAIHNGHLFTVNELNNTLTKHTFPSPSSHETPTLIASAPTLSCPPSVPSPTKPILAAEILIPPPTPSLPTHIYVSNRNDPSPGGDTIAIFDLGTLEMVGEVRTGLSHLRGMVIGGEEERWLVAGGVEGGGVKAFERVDGGRGLREVARCEGIEAPTGFLWRNPEC